MIGFFRAARTRRASYVTCIAALLSATISSAQEPYTPVSGQPGKDAVWVPTTAAMVEKMLDVAKVTPKDFVIDLGSGDGRMIIAAAKRGVPGLGIEFNADLVEFARRDAAAAGVGDKATFAQGDMYAADISKASVMALFLLPSNLEKLAPKFLDLKPGSRIVANTFWIPDWTADATETLQADCDSWCTVQLFIIPAKVAGRWQVPEGGELNLTQTYQMVSGTYTPEGEGPVPVKGRLHGERLTLAVGDTDYEAQVSGDTMEGAATTGDRSKVTATRVR